MKIYKKNMKKCKKGLTTWPESANLSASPAKGGRVKPPQTTKYNMTTQQNTIAVPSQAQTEADKLAARKSAPAASVWEALEWLQLDAYEAQKKSRSAWDRGVAEYMEELLYELANRLRKLNLTDPSSVDVRALLLNGADNWTKYSFGGCTLIYNEDIAERLAPPSRRKRLENNSELAMTCQARALEQAASRIVRLWNKYTQD